LDLLKLAAAGAAQLGASSPEIMGSYTSNTRYFGIGFDELPDDLLR
jgi:hypothetical protein